MGKLRNEETSTLPKFKCAFSSGVEQGVTKLKQLADSHQTGSARTKWLLLPLTPSGNNRLVQYSTIHNLYHFLMSCSLAISWVEIIMLTLFCSWSRWERSTVLWSMWPAVQCLSSWGCHFPSGWAWGYVCVWYFVELS